MNMELGNIFAGRTARCGKPQGHRIVDRLRIRPAQHHASRAPRRRDFPCKRLQRGRSFSPRHPHDGNRTGWPTRGQRKDGLIARMHQLFVPRQTQRQRGLHRRQGGLGYMLQRSMIAPRSAAMPYVFIDSKNSALFLVLRSLSNRKSMPSMVPIGFKIRRSTYIFFST